MAKWRWLAGTPDFILVVAYDNTVGEQLRKIIEDEIYYRTGGTVDELRNVMIKDGCYLRKILPMSAFKLTDKCIPKEVK